MRLRYYCPICRTELVFDESLEAWAVPQSAEGFAKRLGFM